VNTVQDHLPSPAPDDTTNDSRTSALITGGAGFIGSHLVDHLLAHGHAVTVIDDLSTGSRANLPASHPRLTFIHAPLAAALFDIDLASFSHIYHLAAAVGVRRVVLNPIDAIERNTLDAVVLLRALAQLPSTRTPRTLIASSSEVYGKSDRVPFAEGDDAVYGPTTSRRWSYALTKALAEHLALAHHEHAALPVVIVRLFNTVGPRQVGEHGMVLPRFVERALQALPLEVHADGSQTRCFCDVRDVVPALQALLDCPAAIGRVVNVGSDAEISLLDLARLVHATLSSDAGIRFIPYHEALGPGFEDLPRRRPDLSVIRSLISFRPKVPLAQTILDLADDIRCRPSATTAATSPRKDAPKHS